MIFYLIFPHKVISSFLEAAFEYIVSHY